MEDGNTLSQFTLEIYKDAIARTVTEAFTYAVVTDPYDQTRRCVTDTPTTLS